MPPARSAAHPPQTLRCVCPITKKELAAAVAEAKAETAAKVVAKKPKAVVASRVDGTRPNNDGN